MPRPVHFDMSLEDPERGVAFYRDVFGWQVQKWEGPMEYWLVMTGEGEPGIDGGFARRTPDMQAGTMLTIGVPNVDETMESIRRHGGQTLSNKMAIPGVGWHALCQDTEGNMFGVMEADEGAR